MKLSFRFLVRFFAFAAVVGAAFLLIRLMNAPGTQGLMTWDPSYRSVIFVIAAAGGVPFLLAAAYELLHRNPVLKGGAAIGWIALFVSAASAVVCLSGTAYLSLAPNAVARPVPSPNLLDPSKGIPVRSVPDGQPYLRLAFSSDAHWGREESDSAARTQILRTIDSGGFDAFFLLGDVSEMGFPEQGLREAAADLERLVPDVPVRLLMGNHDALINAAGRWKTYFFPKNLSSDSGSPYYYRVDAGKAHILVLNLLWGEEDFDSAQKAWLTDQLKSIPRRDAVIVLSHCFFYASGYVDPKTGSPWYDHPGTIREVVPLLEEYGVDLAVSGHNHFMELIEQGSVAYAIIGTLGGVPDPYPSYRSPGSKWIKTGTFGFLDVSVYPDRMDLAFRGAAGELIHSASVPVD